MTPDQARHGPPDSTAAADAWADREARLAHDEAQLRTGGPHSDEVMSHHQGMPTVETQMQTHGAAPPKVPDTGGHG